MYQDSIASLAFGHFLSGVAVCGVGITAPPLAASFLARPIAYIVGICGLPVGCAGSSLFRSVASSLPTDDLVKLARSLGNALRHILTEEAVGAPGALHQYLQEAIAASSALKAQVPALKSYSFSLLQTSLSHLLPGVNAGENVPWLVRGLGEQLELTLPLIDSIIGGIQCTEANPDALWRCKAALAQAVGDCTLLFDAAREDSHPDLRVQVNDWLCKKISPAGARFFFASLKSLAERYHGAREAYGADLLDYLRKLSEVLVSSKGGARAGALGRHPALAEATDILEKRVLPQALAGKTFLPEMCAQVQVLRAWWACPHPPLPLPAPSASPGCEGCAERPRLGEGEPLCGTCHSLEQARRVLPLLHRVADEVLLEAGSHFTHLVHALPELFAGLVLLVGGLMLFLCSLFIYLEGPAEGAGYLVKLSVPYAFIALLASGLWFAVETLVVGLSNAGGATTGNSSARARRARGWASALPAGIPTALQCLLAAAAGFALGGITELFDSLTELSMDLLVAALGARLSTMALKEVGGAFPDLFPLLFPPPPGPPAAAAAGLAAAAASSAKKAG